MKPRTLMIILVGLAMATSGCLGFLDESEGTPETPPDDGNGDDGNNSDDGTGNDQDDESGDDGSGNETSSDDGNGSDENGSGSGEDNETATPPPTENVTVRSFSYEPENLSVTVNTTVNWTNEANATGDAGLDNHTVTADDGTFDSGEIAPGESFAFTFTEPGTYAYACDLHPLLMTGTITVVEESADDGGGDEESG